MENLNIAIEEWELYNNGILLCKWFDSETDLDDIYNYVREVKKANGLNAEDLELFYADWENDILGIVTESSNIEELFNTYNDLNLDEDQLESLSYLTDCLGYKVTEALEKLEDLEIYHFDNFTDLAYEFVDMGMVGEIPANMINYFDYESFGNDLSFDYDLHNGKIYRAS